jgi:4-diphosphocytidyl-2-C-methyl-D-erythritol kinase
MANRGWNLHWDLDRLTNVAAELGSDVPFFLAPGAAICRGRGERIDRLPPLPALHVVIVKPPVGLNTSAVYQSYAQSAPTSRREPAAALAGLAAGRWCDFRHALGNRLQQAASALSPWIERLRTAFDRLDFIAHQLSGSGSAYFGICRHAQHARRLANILRMQRLGLVYATCSC